MDDTLSAERKREGDGEFELDGDVDLASPFLHNILSDERPAPNFEGVIPPVVAAHMEARNCEATEEDWENMRWPCCAAFLTDPNYKLLEIVLLIG